MAAPASGSAKSISFWLRPRLHAHLEGLIGHGISPSDDGYGGLPTTLPLSKLDFELARRHLLVGEVTSQEFNDDCVRQLKAANFPLRVAVIGSGPSTPYVPSMMKLITSLSTVCGVVAEKDEFPWDFCQKAFNANGTAYYEEIKKTFDTESPLWDARAYKHLVETGFKSYVTPNYDQQLPRAFQEKYSEDFHDRFSVYPGNEPAQPADLEHKQRLVAIHGYADETNPQWPNQIILKTSDYDDHYTNPQNGRTLFHWWKNLLTRFPCVFLGTSLQEPGLDRVVEALKQDGNPRLIELDHIHFVAVARSPQDPYYLPVGSPTLGVFRKIAYDQINQKHSGLLEVLSSFSGISTRNPSPGVTQVHRIKVNDDFSFKSP